MNLVRLLQNHAELLIICAICFLLRIIIECEGRYEFEYILNKTLKRMGFLILLIIAWSSIYELKPKDEIIIGLLTFTYIYIFALLAERCEKTDGFTSGFLLIINCIYITFLSFMPVLGTIIGSLSIIGISVLVYKNWEEKKCDLAENLVLCFETIIISAILLLTKLEQSIYYTLFFLIIEESILDVINKGIRYFVQLKYNEEDSNF